MYLVASAKVYVADQFFAGVPFPEIAADGLPLEPKSPLANVHMYSLPLVGVTHLPSGIVSVAICRFALRATVREFGLV